MACAPLSKYKRILSLLKGFSVDLRLVYSLAGLEQLETALKIVKGWQGLPHPTPLARMRVIIATLEDGGVEDDDRRTEVWMAARYIEIKLAGRKLVT